MLSGKVVMSSNVGCEVDVQPNAAKGTEGQSSTRSLSVVVRMWWREDVRLPDYVAEEAEPS